MKPSEIDEWIAETKAVGVAEFTKRHPGIAFAVETRESEPGEPDAEKARDANGITMRFSRATLRMKPEDVAPPPTSVRIFVPEKSDQGVFKVGRESTSDILLTHPRVSKRHLSIQRVEGSGGFVVKDEGSSNGTLINQRALGRGQIALVDDGDRIDLGRAVVLIPLLSPASLYQFVRGVDAGTAARGPVKRFDVESLARAIVSIGVAAEVGKVEFRLKGPTPDTASDVLVSIDRRLIIVEWGRGGVLLERRSVGTNDLKATASVRQFLLEAIHAFAPEPQSGAYRLDETHTD